MVHSKNLATFITLAPYLGSGQNKCGIQGGLPCNGCRWHHGLPAVCFVKLGGSDRFIGCYGCICLRYSDCCERQCPQVYKNATMAENQSSSKHCSTWVFQAVIGPRSFLQGWQAGIVNWSRKALCSSNMLLLDVLSDCLTWCGIPTSKLCLLTGCWSLAVLQLLLAHPLACAASRGHGYVLRTLTAGCTVLHSFPRLQQLQHAVFPCGLRHVGGCVTAIRCCVSLDTGSHPMTAGAVVIRSQRLKLPCLSMKRSG